MPRWNELRRFCERDGWSLYRESDHYYFEKVTIDGKIKRTMISRGSGEIHYKLWHRILKQQLKVSQEYFNSKI